MTSFLEKRYKFYHSKTLTKQTEQHTDIYIEKWKRTYTNITNIGISLTLIGKSKETFEIIFFSPLGLSKETFDPPSAGRCESESHVSVR